MNSCPVIVIITGYFLAFFIVAYIVKAQNGLQFQSECMHIIAASFK